MPPVTVPVPIATSYFQYDQQGVVFNMWYFGWFDDAMTQFLGEVGYPYTAMNADGLDVQLVHTEADWRDAVRYGEQVVIDVATERIGSTSFTLSFSVRVGEQVRSTGRTVYVVVSTDGSGKRPVPPKLRAGLESALITDAEGGRMQDPSGELTITGVVQREAWLQRAMPPAEQLGEDLWSLPVPIPDNPLRYVSVYAFGTGDGLVLIDAGWGAEESWRALRDGLESIGAGVADVRGVLVTHMHFDHVGLAGRVRQASGAWIAMHPADQAVFARSDYRSAERAVAVEAEFLRGLGASAGRGRDRGRHRQQGGRCSPRPRCPTGCSRTGTRRRTRLETPRRAHPRPRPGRLCFVNELSRRLFSGDHVLPRITPNISVQRGAPPDPLGDYLDSLARTRDLDVDEVLPAHEWRFRGLPGRVDAITAHHERRLAELLGRGPQATPAPRPGSWPGS